MTFLFGGIYKLIKWIVLTTLACVALTFTAVVFGGLIGVAKSAQSFDEIVPIFTNLIGTGAESFDILQNLIDGIPFGDVLQTFLRTFVKTLTGSLTFEFSVNDLMYEVAVFAVASMLYHLFAPILAVLKLGRGGFVLTPRVYDFVSIIYFVVTFGCGAIVTILCERFIEGEALTIYIVLTAAAFLIDFLLTQLRSRGLFGVFSNLLYSLKGIAEQLIKEAAFAVFLVCFTLSSSLALQASTAEVLTTADMTAVCVSAALMLGMLLVICNAGRLLGGK